MWGLFGFWPNLLRGQLLKNEKHRTEGFSERDISSLHAMGYGSGQIEKLSARRRRRRRRRHTIFPEGAAAPPDPA